YPIMSLDKGKWQISMRLKAYSCPAYGWSKSRTNFEIKDRMDTDDWREDNWSSILDNAVRSAPERI
ncbi:hypothetical protein ACFO1V_09515, partial [Daeguia caeni]